MTTKSEDSTLALPTGWLMVNEKRHEEGGGLPRKGEKHKWMRRVLTEAASVEEVKMVLVGEKAAGPSCQRKTDTSVQIFEKWIGDLLEAIKMSLVEIWDAINANTLAVHAKWNSGIEKLQTMVGRVANVIA